MLSRIFEAVQNTRSTCFKQYFIDLLNLANLEQDTLFFLRPVHNSWDNLEIDLCVMHGCPDDRGGSMSVGLL